MHGNCTSVAPLPSLHLLHHSACLERAGSYRLGAAVGVLVATRYVTVGSGKETLYQMT